MAANHVICTVSLPDRWTFTVSFGQNISVHVTLTEDTSAIADWLATMRRNSPCDVVGIHIIFGLEGQGHRAVAFALSLAGQVLIIRLRHRRFHLPPTLYDFMRDRLRTFVGTDLYAVHTNALLMANPMLILGRLGSSRRAIQHGDAVSTLHILNIVLPFIPDFAHDLFDRTWLGPSLDNDQVLLISMWSYVNATIGERFNAHYRITAAEIVLHGGDAATDAAAAQLIAAEITLSAALTAMEENENANDGHQGHHDADEMGGEDFQVEDYFDKFDGQ